MAAIVILAVSRAKNRLKPGHRTVSEDFGGRAPTDGAISGLNE
jgi:hypothetical protein